MKLYSLVMLSIISICTFGQVTSYIDDFESPTVNAAWQSASTTFPLSIESGTLKIGYNRTEISGQWDQFNISFSPTINASSTKQISVKIKSSIAITVAFKPVYSTGDDWIQKSIPGDNTWKEYYFTMSNKASNPISQIYIYFNSGYEGLLESGDVFFDDLKVGSNVVMLAEKTTIMNAIRFAKKLHTNATFGTAEGNYPIGSEAGLISRIAITESLSTVNGISQRTTDSLCAILNDSSMAFEQKITMANTGLNDPKATRQTKILYANLKQLMNSKKFLYGSHDATDYGVGWVNNGTDRSDIKDVSGSHPAIFSWDFAWMNNAERHPYFRNLVASANAQGAIQTFVWHQVDPSGTSFYQKDLPSGTKVVTSILPGGANHSVYKTSLKTMANFAKSMRDTTTGESIPLIFRPYHEHDGNWFWWGKGNCTTAEYNQLWQFTLHYLRDTLNVHNFIYIISPDGNQYSTKEAYLTIYPGDAYVDIFGLDYYFFNQETEYARFGSRMTWIKEYAVERNKVAAVSEIGDELLDMPNWHTKVLQQVKNIDYKIAYMATWRNAGTTHFYAPYKGHSSVNDFLTFAEDSSTFLLNDLNGNANSTLIGSEYFKKSNMARLISFNAPGSSTSSVQNWVPAQNNFTVNVVFNSLSNSVNIKPSFLASSGAIVKVNGQVQNSAVSSISLTNDTKYVVIAQNGKDSCTYTVKIAFLTGVEPSIDTDFSIFPNPTSDKLTVTSAFIPQKIEIYNFSGQRVLNAKPGLEKTEIDLKNVGTGNYVIVIYNPAGYSTSKQFVITK